MKLGEHVRIIDVCSPHLDKTGCVVASVSGGRVVQLHDQDMFVFVEAKLLVSLSAREIPCDHMTSNSLR